MIAPDRTISLDGESEFRHDPAGDLTLAGLGAMHPIVVPSPWQAQRDDLHLTSGVGWYRRRFDVPPDWREGVILLRFGAVDYYAEVWLNGERLGDHEGGYLPFAFEIQDRVFDDRLNELIVRVVDPGLDTAEAFPRFRFAEIPHGKQSWYGPIGGIWQSVVLERRGASYIRALRLTPDAGAGRVAVICEVAHPETGTLLIRITDPDGAVVAETSLATDPSQESYETLVSVPSPRLWDLDRPALYRAEVDVVSTGFGLSPGTSPSPMERRSARGGIRRDAEAGAHGASTPDRVLDRYSETFGFRTIEARDGEIRLNGRAIYLRGALDQAYYPGTIYTPPSEEFLRDRFQKAKELGLNCLRCHIKVEAPLYYRLADELGLLVWTEIPSWGSRARSGERQRTPLAAERARQTLEGMIRRDWNHPSIVCWTIVNENWGTQVGEESSDREWLRETYDLVKRLDPHRLVVDNSACRPNFHVKSDLDDYHFYYAIPDHAERWSAIIAEFASRPAWSYSTHGDAIRSGREPLLVSEFGNWGLPNVHDLIAGHGGEPWWFETGAEWGAGRTRGVVHPKGVLERFAALGLDRVFGTYEAFVAASQEQQYEALKYEIEELRRHDSVKGYVITELTDVHWECNGLLDLCNNPKSYHRRFAAIDADDVIVPSIRPAGRRAFWAGEEVGVDLTVSHFSRQDLDGSMLRWSLDGVEGIGGALTNLRLPAGRALSVGAVRLVAPDVPAPGRVRLSFELAAAEGAVAARNDLDLFVLPSSRRRAEVVRALHLVGPVDRVGDLAGRLAEMGYRIVDDWRQADLVIAVGFDRSVRSIVAEGGRALAFVDDASAVEAGLGTLEVIERVGTGYSGDWASSFSWLYGDRLATRIPSGPRLDWAFATVIPDQVILGAELADLARDGLAGLFLGWIQKPAALALQARLGRGRLLLTTLRLARPKGEPLGIDPIATVMFQDFVEYACSERFAPTFTIE